MSAEAHPVTGAAPPVTVLPEPLRAFTETALRAAGTPDDIAQEVAHHLVGANLAGHDSHGVQRLPAYVESTRTGGIQAGARPEIVRETEACALFDAHRGFGHYTTKVAMNWALDRAPRHGVASAAIRRSTHIGRLGEYSETAAARGLLAIVTVGQAGPAGRWAAPFGGQTRFLGTNPWSFGVPAQTAPYVYDGATTTVAEGKVQLARNRGADLPEGWATDRDGQPTRSTADVYDGGFLVPLGGSVAGHKGSGLGLGAALFGALSLAATPVEEDGNESDLHGVWLLALDPAAFGDPDIYRERTGRNLAALKAMPPAPGFTEVLMPGDPETQSRHRRNAGIPVPAATWQALSEVAQRLGVAPPEAKAGA